MDRNPRRFKDSIYGHIARLGKAVEAVGVLRRKGFKAHRLEQGVLEWRARGWRIEKSAPETRAHGGSRSQP